MEIKAQQYISDRVKMETQQNVNEDTGGLLPIINRIESDMAVLSRAIASTQLALKALAVELKKNGQKVETLQAGQRFLAGQFKNRNGTLYGPRWQPKSDE